MLRLIAIVVLAYVAYRVLRMWVVGGSARRQVKRRPPGRIDDVMLKDPQCGAYFARRDGVALKFEGRELLFCSPECRERFLSANHQPEP
jgi:YHS domain-containing protein